MSRIFLFNDFMIYDLSFYLLLPLSHFLSMSFISLATYDLEIGSGIPIPYLMEIMAVKLSQCVICDVDFNL